MIQEIPRKQILDRFDSLPKNLRDALLSPNLNDEIWRIGRLNHLDDEKISRLSLVAGRVFMGFLDTDDAVKEIKDYVQLPSALADSITRELRRKIFSFYEADIAKVYSPYGAEAAPKTEEIKRTSQMEETAGKRGVAMPVPGRLPTPGTQAPFAVKETPIKPLAAGMGPGTIPMPKPLAMEKITPTAPPQLQAKSTPTTPAPATPFILHKEEAVRPITGEKSFKSFEFEASAPSTIKREEAAPSISARLELGGESAPTGRKKEPVVAKTEIHAPRTVHYSNLRTALLAESPDGQDAKPSVPAPMPFAEMPQPKPIISPETKPSAGKEPLFPKMSAEPESYLHPLPDLWPKTGSDSSPQAEQAEPVEPKPAKIAAEGKKEPAAIITEPETPPAPSAPPQITPKSAVSLDGNTVDLRQKP